MDNFNEDQGSKIDDQAGGRLIEFDDFRDLLSSILDPQFSILDSFVVALFPVSCLKGLTVRRD